MLSFMVLLNNY